MPITGVPNGSLQNTSLFARFVVFAVGARLVLVSVLAQSCIVQNKSSPTIDDGKSVSETNSTDADRCTAPTLVAREIPTLPKVQDGSTVFWLSDPVSPDETVLLAGSQLNATTKAVVQRISDIASSTEARRAGSVEVPIIQPTTYSIKFKIPAEFGPGIYRYSLLLSGGGHLDGFINRPNIWWVQGAPGVSLAAGEIVHVFGRNIGRRRTRYGRGCGPFIALHGPKSVTLAATSEDEYSLQAVLPAWLPTGAYQLYAHNGFGDGSLWSEPVATNVMTQAVTPQVEVDVTKFGAMGSGRNDDIVAFKDAIAAIGKTGGVVFVPRGRYLLGESLTIPRRVILRGEATDQASLVWPDMADPPSSLLVGQGEFGIESLTIHASNYQNVIRNTDGSLGHVRISSVRIRANKYMGHLEQGYAGNPNEARLTERDKRSRPNLDNWGRAQSALDLQGPNVQVVGCDVYASNSSIWLTNAEGAYVSGNSFGNGFAGGYYLASVRNSVFERNEIRGIDPTATGGGINNWGGHATEHIYFARNRVLLAFGHDREAMTSDASGNAFFGHIVEVNGNAMMLGPNEHKHARPEGNWEGEGVFIVSGKGLGQFRRLVSLQGSRLTIDRPWDVAPDTNSLVSITHLLHRLLFIENTFADAGVALQFYGSAVDFIAARNHSARTAGFHSYGMDYYGIQPNWYVQFLENVIDEGNNYRAGHDRMTGDAHIGIYQFGNEYSLARFGIIRGNILMSNAYIQVGGRDVGGLAPSSNENGVTDIVVENNRISHTPTAISVRKPTLGLVERNNHFVDVSNTVDAR